MKVVILGAGALGSVIAAHLVRAGNQVTLLARGQRAAQVQEHGVTVTGLADFHVPIPVETDPQAVRQADVLMVTVKTYDTATALAGIEHIAANSVLSLQNGVLKDDQLAHTFGSDKVVGAMAMFSAEVLPAGTVRFTMNNGFYLGELPEGTSARVQTLAETLEQAGIVARVTRSMQSVEWTKYVAFVCLMAPAVLTRLETYKVLQDPDTAAMVASIAHEMGRIAATLRIRLEDMPPLQIETLSRLAPEAAVSHLRRVGEQFAAQMPRHKISTLQDVEQGKRLEVEETLGYAVRQGAELDVPTPTMAHCYRLLAAINRSLR